MMRTHLLSSCSLIVWGFASKGRTQLSYLRKGSVCYKVFKLIDYDNVATPVVIYKVCMMLKVYYYNNSVTYNGSLWVLDGVAVGASAAAGRSPKTAQPYGLNK